MSDYSTQHNQNSADRTQKYPTKELDSQVNSRSNSFLRSLKSSKQNRTSEIELEEGETISPSPSPRHSHTKTSEKSKNTSKRETLKEKEKSPNRHTSSRRREDSKRSGARQEHKSSRHDSDNDSNSRRRSSPDKRKDKGPRSSRHHSRSRSTSRSRTPPSRKSRNRSVDTKPSRSESSRRRSPQPTSRSDKSNGSSNNNRNSENDNHSNKRRRSSRDKRDNSIEKSGSTSKTATSYNSKSQPKENKPKTISATAPDSETPGQQKLFIIMFSKLAHANKRRGDGQTEELFGMIDHFHALCDYILNFYYVDKNSSDNISFKQASVAWKSLFPFTDSLLAKLESHQHYDLYGLCARLISLVRYYIYKRMIDSTRLLLSKQLSDDGDESSSSRVCIQVSEGLLREYEKAERWYKTSEKYLSYSTIATQFPQTFKSVCLKGDLSKGITLGGEAGVSVEPMFPFTPYSPLHHSAIVSKCMLSEYVSIKKLDYSPISPEEYMN